MCRRCAVIISGSPVRSICSVPAGAPPIQWVPSVQRRWRWQTRVRLQVQPCRLGPSGACGRAQPAAFPRSRDHGAEAEPPGRTRPVRRKGFLSGPGRQGPPQDVFRDAAERGDSGARFGVEVHLAVRTVALEQASADLEERGDEVSDAEPVAVGQPVQVRKVRLALQRRDSYRPRSCRSRMRWLRLWWKKVVHQGVEVVSWRTRMYWHPSRGERGIGADG